MEEKKSKKFGSGTLVVILSAIVFLTYAVSTNSDIRHMKYMQENYEENIRKTYKEKIEKVLNKQDRYIAERKNVHNMTRTSDDYEIPVPRGFVLSNVATENTYEGGAVIYEGEEAVTDSNVDTAQKTRNQFVWVPVEDINKFYTTTTYTGTITPTNYIEPYKVSEDPTGEVLEYNNLRRSVNKYKGFYIGRYEAGDATTTTTRTSSSNSINAKVVSQKDKFVFNYIKWGTSRTNVISLDTAVAKARSLYQNHPDIVSHLTYGVQWDTTLTWLHTKSGINVTDSRGWGNHSNSTGAAGTGAGVARKTGYSEAWKAHNIYDLAGNYAEWTMEYSSSYGINRGGRHSLGGETTSVSHRPTASINGSFVGIAFRISIYLK
ncbi:MAG: hypothetical protein PHR25_03785 [Clostridia bacterium]|nr:hypothetical protein [Clostridia bacterium]MDD4375883.1 hypothetical protein [Clostridia bacterium]